MTLLPGAAVTLMKIGAFWARNNGFGRHRDQPEGLRQQHGRQHVYGRGWRKLSAAPRKPSVLPLGRRVGEIFKFSSVPNG